MPMPASCERAGFSSMRVKSPTSLSISSSFFAQQTTTKSTSSMYDGGVDGDSLREVLQKACKHIDIGTAVLPKPLLSYDVDEDDLGGSREGMAPEKFHSPTITRYARTINREFNAVVVEHHLKWAPLCVSHSLIPLL